MKNPNITRINNINKYIIILIIVTNNPKTLPVQVSVDSTLTLSLSSCGILSIEP